MFAPRRLPFLRGATTRTHRCLSSAAPGKKRRVWPRAALLAVLTTSAGYYYYSSSKRIWSRDVKNADPTVSFLPYELISRDDVSPTSSIITVRPIGFAQGASRFRQLHDEAWRRGCWSLFFKQPLIQIGRSFTPLPQPPLAENHEDHKHDENDVLELRFLIRRVVRGEMSNYLHSLRRGSTIEIRGPEVVDFDIPPHASQLLFIAGGTGIASALQAAHVLLNRQQNDATPAAQPQRDGKDEAKTAIDQTPLRIKILWANRRREDCLGGRDETPPLSWTDWALGRRKKGKHADELLPARQREQEHAIVRHIEDLRDRFPGRLSIEYFVDEEGSFITKRDVLEFTSTATAAADDDDDGRGRRRRPGRNLVLVAGPPGFVSYMAGPPLLGGGATFLQGPIGGILGELDLRNWLIWKL